MEGGEVKGETKSVRFGVTETDAPESNMMSNALFFVSSDVDNKTFRIVKISSFFRRFVSSGIVNSICSSSVCDAAEARVRNEL
ncbi:MAG: hypothetical protein ACREBR_02145 [bacterium]